MRIRQLNKPLFVGIFLLLIWACHEDESHDKVNAAEEVSRTLDRWHRAAAEADFDTYFSLMDRDAIFVGTDASEVWNKDAFMAFAKPYFDKGKAWHFKKINRHVYRDSVSPATVWFDETLDTWMGGCRGSGVLINKDGKWLIKHYVLSLTVPNEKMNQVISVIRHDSLR